MIIVSQDKDSIINFDRTQNIWIDDNVLDKINTSFEIRADDVTLGEYTTGERANEVLEEIIENIQCKSFVEMNADGVTSGVTGGIYRMPKE